VLLAALSIVLQGSRQCYKGLSTVFHWVSSMLQGALHCVTRGSLLCYKGLSTVLQGALHSSTRGSKIGWSDFALFYNFKFCKAGMVRYGQKTCFHKKIF